MVSEMRLILPEAVYSSYTDSGAKHAEALYWRLRKKYMKASGERVVDFDIINEIKEAKMFGRWGDFYPNAIKVLCNLCSAFGTDFRDLAEYQGYKEGMSFRDLHYLFFD